MLNTEEETAPTVTVCVTIGHNGPDNLPLSSSDVADFRYDTAAAILKVQQAVYAHGITTGVFENDPEPGDVWIFTASGHDVRCILRPRLQEIAKKYRQQAIGLICQPNTRTPIYA